MPEKLLITARDVQKILRCSLPLIYRMADRGQIPSVRWECPGKGTKKPRTMVRFKLSDVKEFIEKHHSTT
ncbi:helix-turn-helix domain-containing protein [Thermodesulfobacteriota bacterium]